MGSRGTWTAAVSGVAAAIAATDMVVRGECVNAFCIVRPPGHHAGRNLHPMKAVSNGFCILNAVACAAIHATLPLSEGGLGLSRVCVIDFDAHHGNGTQDILCSTFDPRFLYVSLHAGGSEINGHPMDDDPGNELHDLVSHPKLSGIFPGRCGDTSSHESVLNIPLGETVTSHAIGMALISQVSPKVAAFSPDLILLSAGFDAHRNDPMGLGALRAEDFGHITQAACEIAFSSCSGRVVSVLEGGYGVPCCRPQKDLFLPKSKDENIVNDATNAVPTNEKATTQAHGPSDPTTKTNGHSSKAGEKRPQPSQLLDLGDDMPESMDDQVPFALQARLEKCHNEGFVDCVFHHVQSLVQCSKLR